MLVSVIISAYNEEKYLPNVFQALKKQTYPHSKIEVVLVNGMSTDHTKELLEEFQKDNSNEFYNIQVWDNPQKTLATGLNLAIEKGVGEAYLKIDAHSLVTDDFIEQNVQQLLAGEKVCGGKRPTIIEEDTNMARTLHAVEEAMFGSSIANYRKSDHECYVSSVFQGMYHKDVIDKCGVFDEQLVRTEDNEFHWRIRENGFKIKYSPKILSYQYMRPTFSKMVKQKYGNGYWIGLTSHVKPRCLSLYHYVPFVFVLAIIVSLLISSVTVLPLILLAISYGSVVLFITLATLVTTPFNICNLLMPFLLLSVHVSYGVGTLVGLIKGFSWKKRYHH